MKDIDVSWYWFVTFLYGVWCGRDICGHRLTFTIIIKTLACCVIKPKHLLLEIDDEWAALILIGCQSWSESKEKDFPAKQQRQVKWWSGRTRYVVCVCVMKRWWVCYLNKRAALWRCVWTVSPGWITFICPAPNHSLFTWSGPDEAAERKRGLVPAGQTEFLLHQSTGQTNMCCSSLLQQKWRAAPLFISRLYSYCSNNQIPANKVTDERTGSWEPLAYELLTANRC